MIAVVTFALVLAALRSGMVAFKAFREGLDDMSLKLVLGGRRPLTMLQ